MIVTACARRLGVSAVGIVGVLAFTVGCSSSSAGKPVPATNKPAVSASAAASLTVPSGSASVPTLPSGLPSSLPVNVPSSIPALGGKDPFCKELSSEQLASLGSATAGGDISGAVKIWDKIAADAPAAIKADAKSVDAFLHTVQAGNPDVSKAQELSGAIQRITSWISTNCI
jgi:hypothetical protein